MKIKISKPLPSAPWRVDCEHCAGDIGEGNIMAMFGPWAFCRDHRTAVRVAAWHLRLHREQTCGTCGNTPRLPALKPLDEPGLFKLGDEVYYLPFEAEPRKVVGA